MIAQRTALQAVAANNRDTVFEISFIDGEIQGSGCQLQMRCRRRADRARIAVDWGDGEWNEWTQDGEFILWHNFRGFGPYTVRIDDGLSWFRLRDALALSPDGPLICRPNIRPVQWGDWVESAEGTYCGWNRWYGDMKGVWGTPPRWGRRTRSATSCYEADLAVCGAPAAWTAAIEECSNCYRGTAVSGRVPNWNSAVRNVYGCYDGCAGLTGRLPPWPPSATNLSRVFAGCNGIDEQPVEPFPSSAREVRGAFDGNLRVRGRIPPWPPALEWADEVYRGCSGLDGAWTRDPAELMPERVAHHRQAVEGTAEGLRSLFSEEWGGTRED